MPKKNIPLLKRLRVRFLRMRHPEHFDMTPIAAKTDCGAAMCVGGHTLDLAGYKMRVHKDAEPLGYFWLGQQDYDFISPKGRVVQPLVAARRELGLSDNEATKLFHDWSLKTPKDAARRIEQIIAEAEV